MEMNCEFDKTKISAYIDGELSTEEIRETEEHIKSCSECKAFYEELMEMKEMLFEMEEIELPQGYEDELHKRLSSSFGMNKAKKNYNWKKWTAVAAILLVGFVSYNVWKPAGLMMKSAEDGMAAETVEMSIAAEPRMPDRALIEEQGYGNKSETATDYESREGSADINDEGRKIIRNGYINLEVDSFEVAHEEIVFLTEASGGFIQNSSTGKRYYNGSENQNTFLVGSLNLRIPEESFMDVYNKIKELGEVSDSNIGGSDITFQYNDISSQIDNLDVQEARLREIMEKAETVEELLQVERELNRVRTEIDRMTGMIKNWDNLVSYSTINVQLTEVEPKSTEIEGFENDFWEKAKREFVKSINRVIIISQDLFVWFIAVLPFVFIIGSITIVAAIVLKRKRKRK